jgi:hypothetical protein
MKTRNAKFWAWVNDGQVRITLRPGQSLHWGKSWRHDEGWSSEGETWTHVGTAVERDAWTDGRDFEGRLSTETRLFCPLERLHAREVDGLFLPDWQRIESSQRDYQAEAAGY